MSKPISRNKNQEIDFEKLCKLARLEIPESDKNSLIADLEDILALAKKVQNLDLSDVLPLYHPRDINQILREDLEISTPIEQYRDKLLANSPKSDSRNFLVPKVIE